MREEGSAAIMCDNMEMLNHPSSPPLKKLNADPKLYKAKDCNVNATKPDS